MGRVIYKDCIVNRQFFIYSSLVCNPVVHLRTAESHVEVYGPDCLLHSVWSDVCPVGRLGPHSLSSATRMNGSLMVVLSSSSSSPSSFSSSSFSTSALEIASEIDRAVRTN